MAWSGVGSAVRLSRASFGESYIAVGAMALRVYGGGVLGVFTRSKAIALI